MEFFFLLKLAHPPKPATVQMMSSSKEAWFDFVSDSSDKLIKDERFDVERTDNSSLQTNDIDYTIVDSQIDLLNSKPHHPIEPKSSLVKAKKSSTMKRKNIDRFFFT